MNELDPLNVQVTAATLEAQMLDSEARKAYKLVSEVEQRIATLTSSSSHEGVLARRGAVRAAINAQDYQLTVTLVRKYIGDADEALLQDLIELMAIAVTRAGQKRMGV